jgi:hypothetical protein
MPELPVSLKRISHEGEVDGFLYRSEMTQSYRNDSEVNLETVYSFPVSEEAGMSGFRASVNGKALEGELLARETAEELYEDALADGDTPVLLYESSPGILTLSIGNLAPSDVCEASLSLVELLRFEGSLARITVPTVLAPRSGDMYLAGELKPHESIESSARAGYGLSVDVRIPFHGPGSRVCCPSHVTSCRLEEDGVAVFISGYPPLPNRDFVLLLENVWPPHEAGAYAFFDEREGLWGVLALYHPEIPEGPEEGTLYVLMDASFTMKEAGFDQGIRLASSVLAELGARGRDSTVHIFSDLGLQEIRPDASAGWSYGRLYPRLRGTVTSSAKKLADALKPFSLPVPPCPGDAPPALLLVTDCLEAGASDILDAARELYPRLFAASVGHSPLSGRLRRLAEAAPGGGFAVAPAPAEGHDVAGKALAMAIRARAVDSAIHDWGGRMPLWASPPPRMLLPGVTFPAWALMDGPPESSPSLAWRHGRRDGGSMTAKLLPGKYTRELSVLLSTQRIRQSESSAEARTPTGNGRSRVAPTGGGLPARESPAWDRPGGDSWTGIRPGSDSVTGYRTCGESRTGDLPAGESAAEDRPSGESRAAAGVSGSGALDSQERTALALRQGVLAAGTAWCLVYRRYPDQKARGIPELQQIPQTTPERRPPVEEDLSDYDHWAGSCEMEIPEDDSGTRPSATERELTDDEAPRLEELYLGELKYSLERPDPDNPPPPFFRRRR